jgi:exodeoxyribonuclease VII small subunit
VNPKTPKPAPGGDAPVSFEDAMSRLERIVADLEGGRFTLEESLQKFEEGIALGNQCRRILEKADLRVRTLVEAGDRLIASDAPERDSVIPPSLDHDD